MVLLLYLQRLIQNIMEELEKDAGVRFFRVLGDTMEDGTKKGYYRGDIVVCREATQGVKLLSIVDNYDFVIVHSSGVLLTRILSYDIADKTIRTRLLNPSYPEKTLHLEEVRQLFFVESSITKRT